ncbi:hypothetical protein B0H13DRAFT_2315392 [Mycena leptocephala]|nr:hypothetical protein B0H13DRAFT_2315392 [Mycena leptocephala]
MTTYDRSHTDIDGFDLQVEIPQYEDLATELDELNCMRLRVLHRSANLEASPPKTSPTQGFAAIGPSRGEQPGELLGKMHHAASSHWVMVAPVHMRSPGNPDPPYVRQRLTHEVVETSANIQAKPPWGEMVGRLEFSDYDKETDSRYDMLFDLGSSPFWVISSDLESIFMGATEFGQGAHVLVKQDRNIRVNPGPFTASYVDGSGVTYSTVRDVLQIPASEHLPVNLRQPRWIHVIIGVANHARGRALGK